TARISRHTRRSRSSRTNGKLSSSIYLHINIWSLISSLVPWGSFPLPWILLRRVYKKLPPYWQGNQHSNTSSP
ncbi:hypothetical protein K443DRAFT_638925, partial [Laccaria amethystina LaAM-08-1]